MAQSNLPVIAGVAAAGFSALLSVLFFTASVASFRVGGCSFNVNDGVLPTPEPLYLQPSGSLDVNGYILPDGSGNIQLATGDKVLIACPGKKVASLQEEVTAVCKSGTVFTVNNADYDLLDLGCSEDPTHTAVKTKQTCGENGRGELAQIGHETSRGLVVIIEACFQNKTLEALYSTAIVSGKIGGRRSGVDRPLFIAGNGFYGSVVPNSHYVRTGQQSAFAKILDSQELAYEYIANSTDYYLARGHLVAKADFIWAQQQRATFYYINVAPQWQTFNGGNWEALESSVRSLAKKLERDLLVITGTWDRAILPDVKGVDKELFVNAEGLIPVPALYWKVVYDSSTGEGAAFVGVNNPYTTLAQEKRLTLCTDMCASISWVTWKPTNQALGEGYCCEVDALRKAIPDIPQLKVTSLLK